MSDVKNKIQKNVPKSTPQLTQKESDVLPQLENNLQMPRYFVEVRAILKDGLYVVKEMLHPPTLDLPKFIKAPKKKQPKN